MEGRDLLAAQIARDLLGSAGNQAQPLPPQVQLPPPPAPAPEEPVAAVPEEKDAVVPEVQDEPANDPAPANQPSQSSRSNALPNPPVTLHRQLLSRLIRALPIASEAQLQSMLNVFDHRANPPAVQNPPLPPPPSSVPQASAPVQSRWQSLPPAPHSHHPGGISYGRAPTTDPLQHLLPQPSYKRSELH